MTTCPDQSEPLGPIETLDECLLEALGSKPETLKQDYLKAYVPQPTMSFLHILRTQRSGIQGSALPPAWRPVQLALARVLSLPIKLGEKTCEPCTELVDGLPDRYNPSLKKLLMVLYYHQIQELVGEMSCAGADTKKQKEILRKLAKPLHRYSKYISLSTSYVLVINSLPAEAVEAAGAHPFESDPIRRSLYNLFDLPFITTGKTFLEGPSLPPGLSIWSTNPLIVVLHYIRRSIRKRGLEAFIHGAIDIFARQVIAFTGGLILIIPMIMMTFLTRPHARLIVVCCFVVGFAGLMGIFTRATNQEVLAATAVYTAVLAVFV